MSFPQGNQKRKIPAVYDAANYGYDLKIPLVDPRLTGATTFTGSASATVHRTTDHDFTPSGSTSVAYTPLLHSTDTVLTSLDTHLIYHEGNNTPFDQDYLIPADMTAIVHQIELSFAVALNCSAYVDGSPVLNYVRLEIASYQRSSAPLLPPMTAILRPSSAFTALAATGTHLFIVRDTIDIPFRIQQNGPITLNMQINVTGDSANDTIQVGIVDVYPVAKTSATKRLFASELIAHIHTAPEHIENVNQLTDWTLLGSGVNKST
jgi:hypothetical protein